MMQYVSSVLSFGEEYKSEMTKNILLCSDENYIKYVGIAALSILCNSKQNLQFHIFCDDISKENIRRFRNLATKNKTCIKIYKLNRLLLTQLPLHTTNARIPEATYYRILAFNELAEEIDDVLYVDADVCIGKDFDSIWQYNPDNVGSLSDKNILATVIKDNAELKNAKRLKTTRYFNAGVMYVNLKMWCAMQLSNMCISKLKNNSYLYMDQDVLNIVLDGKCHFIEDKYNYQYSLSKLIDNSPNPSGELLRDDAIIVHFIGASKPWNTWAPCCQAVKIWRQFKDESLWSDCKLISPGRNYKYWHKGARIAKKEGDYSKMICCYAYYFVYKILHFLQ